MAYTFWTNECFQNGVQVRVNKARVAYLLSSVIAQYSSSKSIMIEDMHHK